MTGTLQGEIVVWDESPLQDADAEAGERRAIKIVSFNPNIQENVLPTEEDLKFPFCVVDTIGEYLVVGDCEGSVRFYDFQFRAWAWFENPSDGEIRSISFAHESTLEEEEENNSDDW